MSLFETIRNTFGRDSKSLYGPPKKKPMTEAVAEKFLWEVMLTDKWDPLFHQSGFSLEGLQFGRVTKENGLKTIHELGKFPRVLAPAFVVREVQWRKDSPYWEPEIRFVGKDPNDNISVTLEGSGDQWKPVGLWINLLGKHREDDGLLITGHLIVL